MKTFFKCWILFWVIALVGFYLSTGSSLLGLCIKANVLLFIIGKILVFYTRDDRRKRVRRY